MWKHRRSVMLRSSAKSKPGEALHPETCCCDAAAMFQQLIKDSDDIFMCLFPDSTIEYVSPSVERVLGYRLEEMLGVPAADFALPEDLQRLGVTKREVGGVAERRTVYEPSMELLRKVSSGVQNLRVRHRDGHYLWLEVTFNFVIGEQGDPVRIVGVCRDVTDRKRTEEELRRSQANLLLAQRIAGLGHYEWDLKSDELVWSDEMYTVLGYKRSDFAHDKEAFDRLVHPEDRPGLIQYCKEMIKSGTDSELTYTFRIFAVDGGIRLIQTLGKLLKDEDGTVVRLFGTVRDITNESQTEELLRNSEKLKMAGQLAAGIAHEIRNPLTSLKGFSKLLRTATGEQADRYYAIMDQEFVRIEMILGELLMLAKPQASVYQSWDVRSIVHEVADLLGSQAILSNVVIREEMTEEACPVRCDKNELKQVFMNIVKNAIEAMPSGGTLVIRVERDAGHVFVRVIDQGEGIPEDKLKRLGEPFFTTKEKGTGLGLMISHKIIEQHEGRILFDSEVGVGTTVTVRLPLYSEGR